METAAKVLIIIGMIAGCYMVFPIILGAIALSKMSKGQMTTGWKIVVLLCVNTIAGILLLCMPDNKNTNNNPPQTY